MKKQSSAKGSLMLLMAAFFWGTTFVAQSAAAKCIGAFTFNATRSFVGALFLAILVGLRRAAKKGEHIEQKENSEKANPVSVWKAGIICGLVLFAAMNFQQTGITLYPDGVASSGRSGFLTATYVIIVALCSKWLGKKVHPIIGVATVICIVGMYFLCMAQGFSGVYFGDVLGIICAFCFATHIMVVDHFSDCDSVALSCIQFLTSGTLSLVAMFLFEQPAVLQIWKAGVPILYAGIFSSGVAYTLQMAGQKYAAPAVASIVMSLESVFAVIGGFIILQERLTQREALGCVLVFAAVMIAQVPDMIGKKMEHK
ncbi:MAG: DMT family transporter [Eubacteriales bacterium]|nr:DMT family transporter [Eubacteriales bacterium]